MILTVYAEPQLVGLVATTLADAFTLGKLATKIPKAISITTADGKPELQVEIADLVALATA